MKIFIAIEKSAKGHSSLSPGKTPLTQWGHCHSDLNFCKSQKLKLKCFSQLWIEWGIQKCMLKKIDKRIQNICQKCFDPYHIPGAEKWCKSSFEMKSTASFVSISISEFYDRYNKNTIGNEMRHIIRQCCHQKLCHIFLDWQHLWWIHWLCKYNNQVILR